MMKRIKMLCLILGMSALVVACGKDDKVPTEMPGAENVGSVGEEEQEKQPDEEEDKPENDKEVKKCTYVNVFFDSRYIIDMVEYPDWDSGQGKLEDLGDGIYLGVSNYDDFTSLLWEEAVLENVSSVTDIPEIMENPIAATFDVAKYNGVDVAVFDFVGMDYSSIEEIGEVNGYPMCRFEGDYVIDEEGEVRFSVVGYTTFLKQSGYPIYVAAIDMGEKQSNRDQLDKISYECIQTLREITEEELREMGY